MKRIIKHLILLLLSATSLLACKKDDKPALPEVITGDVVSVTAHTASIGSTVNFDESFPLTARGICWNTSPNPTIDNSSTSDSLIGGLLYTIINGLQHSATYYVKAYATNAEGTAYGEEKTFTTNAVILPVLSDITTLHKDASLYEISGTVLSDGNSPIISKGICVSTSSTPSLNDKTEADSSIGLTINRLVHAPQYTGILYVCSYATNEAGTSYSASKQLIFSFNEFPQPDPDCKGCPIALKPNIYLYPTKTEQLQVNLAFPKNGRVVTSIPDYGQGWNVNVQPDGTIDNKYGYLFYESAQPDVWQKSKGWSVKKADLKQFFEKNLAQYGFAGSEISDFTEYWIPLLSQYEYFSIYPQDKKTVGSVISLTISTAPDNIQRLFYFIEGTQSSVALTAPIIANDFVRNGFFATEWGVVLAQDTKIAK